MQRQNKSQNKHTRWIGGPVLTIILSSLLLLVVSAGCSEKLTPEEVARNWVNDNVAIGSEMLVEWILGESPVEVSSAVAQLAQTKGSDLVEDMVHEVIQWEYSPARGTRDGWEVTVTASVSFPDYANFEAGLPLVLEIEGEEVTNWRADYMSAYARADIPNIGDVVSTVSTIADVLGAEDCLEAARAAGVPDAVFEHLNKPASERNFMEKAAIDAAVGAVDLPEGCADSLVGE